MSSMLQSQVAGRHSSYATQFWRSSARPFYRSRADMRAAHSRKAVNRRLVLPLDSHNWVRSLEVLNARYARLGRTPEHFQMVLRDMVQHHRVYEELRAHSSGPEQGSTDRPRQDGSVAAAAAAATTAPVVSGQSVADVVSAIDSVRDKAFAGEIPSNGSLWVTLVWSYCTLQHPQQALETFEQARRRFRFSSATLQHMAELLLPVLCHSGHLDEATALYSTHLAPSTVEGGSTTPRSADALRRDDSAAEAASSSPAVRRSSNLSDAQARRWLAEAAARRGDWKKAREFSVGLADASGGPSSALIVEESSASSEAAHALAARGPTLHSLFHSDDTRVAAPPSPPPPLSPSQQGASARPTAVLSSRPSSTLPRLALLSTEAVRRLFHALCREGAAAPTEAHFVGDAVACWERLYGPLPGGPPPTASPAGSAEGQQRRERAAPAPPVHDVRELLNLFASHGKWGPLLDCFSAVFLHRRSSVYLDACPEDLRRLRDPADATCRGEGSVDHGDSGSVATEFPYDRELPLDAVLLNLLFASLPKAAEPLSLHTLSTHGTGSSTGADGSRVLQLPAAARPVTVVRLLDDLLLYRDDMQLTDVVAAVVGPALLQVGQTHRLFELLMRTPMLLKARERKAALQLSSHERELKAVLVSLGYAAYALSEEAERRAAMVRAMPFLFPPEVVRSFAREEGMGEGADAAASSTTRGALAVLRGPVVHVTTEEAEGALYNVAAVRQPPSPPASHTSARSAEAGSGDRTAAKQPLSTAAKRDSSASPAGGAAATPSLLDLKWASYSSAATSATAAACTAPAVTAVSQQRGGNTKSRRGRGSAVLTALADDAMRRDFLRLHENRREAFTGSHADAERDPRPIPTGLHDHASGWDFFGRGGEKAFSNSKRTPHPFTMQPKVMRDLRNPYRGWSPRRNSSLAHKENVIKWNGKSSV